MAVEWAVGARYHGVEIKDVDPTVKCRHAKHGYDSKKLAILSDASLLMLADSVLLVVCDQCGYNGITAYRPYVTPEGATTGTYKPIIKQADSVLAHANGKHRRGTGVKAARNARLAAAGVSREDISRAAVRRVLAEVKAKTEPKSSRYTTNQIKVFIKIWLKWKSTGIKTWTQAACDEIEKLGFETQFGNGWNPDQLGSLVRSYMHKPEFRNVKAGPLDDNDKATLEAMIRESADRVGRTGNHVADNARITVKPTRKPAWHEKLPTTETNDEAAQEQQEEEDTVVASSRESLPAPTLNFASPGAGAMEPVKVLTVPTVASHSIPAQRSPAPAAVPVQVPVESDFALVAVMDDGAIILTYKGVLMGAKPIKGFQL